jgi:hypothetical protein
LEIGRKNSGEEKQTGTSGYENLENRPPFPKRTAYIPYQEREEINAL